MNLLKTYDKKRLYLRLAMMVTFMMTSIVVTIVTLTAREARARMGRQTAIMWSVQVVDPDGMPVTAASAIYKDANDEKEWPFRAWLHADDNGDIRGNYPSYRDGQTPDAFDVLVRAPGFAHALVQVAKDDMTTVVPLERGRHVRVRLMGHDGQPLPESVQPVLFTDDVEALAWSYAVHGAKRAGGNHEHGGSLGIPEPEGEGVFRIPLREDVEAFHILVSAKGIIDYYTQGPFSAASEDVHVVTLPETGRVLFDVVVSEELLENMDVYDYSFIKAAKPDGGRPRSRAVVNEFVQPGAPIQREFHLVPGPYGIMLHAFPGRVERGRPAIPQTRFVGPRAVEVVQGKTVEVRYEVEAVDASVARGDHRAVLTMVNARGETAGGAKYVILYGDDEVSEVLVAEGEVPGDGVLTLEGLADKDKHETYSVIIDGEYAGYFFIRDGQPEVHRTIRIPPKAGDPAPAFKAEDMLTGESIDSAAWAGKVIYLDFWATWCGPCQVPMEKLNQFSGKQPAHWQDRVVLAGLSIDEKRDALAKHIERKGWTAVRQLWANDGKGFRSDAAKAYGINGVPTALLIDTRGQIVWRGHPSSKNFDLSTRIDELLDQAD